LETILQLLSKTNSVIKYNGTINQAGDAQKERSKQKSRLFASAISKSRKTFMKDDG
jgi:hypothetical protein